MSQDLAIFGGKPAISNSAFDDAFTWPIMGDEEQRAVRRVMEKKNFFDEDAVTQFEADFARFQGMRHAVSTCNGTTAILAALWAVGVRRGDEVIMPSAVYWAAGLQAMSLGATIVFADIQPETLNIDPAHVESLVTPRTKAIIAVHMLGYPADLNALASIADRHGIALVEDASHAHGSLYRGRKVGTIGRVAGFSCCGKPLAIGEGGMLVTDDTNVYERSLAFLHNFRNNSTNIRSPELLKCSNLPWGMVTARMHNLSAALGVVQLARYPERMAEVDRAMSLLCDHLEGTPGLRVHRPPKGSGSTMGGWYLPHLIYRPEELHGLSVSRYAEAVRAEGWFTRTRTIIKEPLHLHPLLNTVDVYGDSKPTRIAFADRDVRTPAGSLPVTESVKSLTAPPFKLHLPALIEQYANAFRKVSAGHEQLLAGDRGDGAVIADDRGDG